MCCELCMCRQLPQEALEIKKAKEEAVHNYVSKQRQYDSIAQEVKVHACAASLQLTLKY